MSHEWGPGCLLRLGIWGRNGVLECIMMFGVHMLLRLLKSVPELAVMFLESSILGRQSLSPLLSLPPLAFSIS